MESIGVALFGLGRIGKIHLKNVLLNKRLTLLWIVDESEDNVKAELEHYGGQKEIQIAATRQIENVLADDRVSAVVICTPTDTHADLTIQSIKAGKHVMCEKPMSESNEKVAECYDTSEQCGKILFDAFNRKFDKSYRSMYDKVRSGEVGEVQFIRSTFRDTPLWRGAETFTQTFLCHDIDICCWFAGELPDSVVCVATAHDEKIKQAGDVDSCVVTMKFPNGAIGVMDFARYSCYGYDIRLEVFGTRGMLKMEPALESTVNEYRLTGKQESPFCASFPQRFQDAYIAELDHFIDAIQGKVEIYVGREVCERIGIVLDAIKQSYKTGTVVKITSNKQ
ncbi:myo-inositol 2-dehydrogenase-like [Dreissena polymorpha]|uniref:Inositol 2-dehydrogenase n=1 Tax=Dreissena polymorpha TaxID=45954 RepID=A0A9D4JZC6_DREPO|nr:myo-inositol 2-dehydrogenase-like [Dreissena polymorpha]KAH3828679.1 hypothetical protein DPMN_130661 [Dreissena polymorpha]